MDVTEYKKEIEKVQGRVKKIEEELIKVKTLKETSIKELFDSFGISEDKIPDKLKELKESLNATEADLEKRLKEFKDYISKIEERLA